MFNKEIKLSYEFKNDLKNFVKKSFLILFIICTWYSLTMLQLDTFKLSILGHTKEEDLFFISYMGWFILEVCIGSVFLILVFLVSLFIKEFFNYAFIVNEKNSTMKQKLMALIIRYNNTYYKDDNIRMDTLIKLKKEMEDILKQYNYKDKYVVLTFAKNMVYVHTSNTDKLPVIE